MFFCLWFCKHVYDLSFRVDERPEVGSCSCSLSAPTLQAAHDEGNHDGENQTSDDRDMDSVIEFTEEEVQADQDQDEKDQALNGCSHLYRSSASRRDIERASSSIPILIPGSGTQGDWGRS